MAACLAYCAGCNSSSGPEKFTVSGQVLIDGDPVPRGEVSFAPDPDKGNSGPGSVAKIVDGRYSTAESKGVVGGAYIVRIVAFDGVPTEDSVDGTPLTKSSYKVEVDLPTESSTRNFEIPKSHLAKTGR